MKKLILKLIKSKRARARALPLLKQTLVLTMISLVVLGLSPNFKYEAASAKPAVLAIQSAAVQDQITAVQADERVIKLTKYLESKDSILAPYAADFVASADRYGLDWKFLVAISGDESGFAKQYVGGSYNAWGWGGGYLNLASWPNAIEVISKALKENYREKWGASSVEQVGKIWAEDPFWATKVKMYLNQIDKFAI